MARRFYLTTPIYYVNDVPHIGTSYTTMAADVLARFHRLRGEEVLFATGVDENAPKVVQAAEGRGMDPLAFVDEMADRFRRAWSALNIAPDVFIRTTEPRHFRAVQHFFRTLQERGDIYQGPYEGWYCINCETYFAADEAPEANGVRPCPNEPLHPPLRLVQETNYFFALSRYGERLLAHIEAHPEFLQPGFRRNEVLSFIRQGLRDVCITRGATGWGIPVPDDPSQVIYVWFDALINYLTLAGYPDDAESLAKWWPCDLHLVGKDIYVRFHCTLWPAMLMAAGLALPRTVFGHGFWMSEGRKMSKSLGNFLEPRSLAEWLAGLSGAPRPVAVDALRYFLFREMPFGEDGNFSRRSLLQRFNGDLANDLGNALNRSLSMAGKHFPDGLPAGDPVLADPLPERARETHACVTGALEQADLQGALAAAWEFVGAINKYVDDRAPWSLARDGRREELGAALAAALEGVRAVSVWLAPYMPCAAAELRRQLGVGEVVAWDDAARWGLLPAGVSPASARPIFPRIAKETMEKALQDVAVPVEPSAPAPGPSAAPAAATETITIDEFAKIQLRVAEVLAAERVPNADKLLHLRVSLGDEERTVLAGMAEWYAPETLVGRKVVMVVNLAPRKMRGLVSQGMLLAAEAGDVVSLLQPDQDLPAGAKIR